MGTDAQRRARHERADRVELKRLRQRSPFNIRAREDELRERLSAIAGMHLQKPDYPDVRFADMTSDDVEIFVEAMGWAADRIRAVHREFTL